MQYPADDNVCFIKPIQALYAHSILYILGCPQRVDMEKSKLEESPEITSRPDSAGASEPVNSTMPSEHNIDDGNSSWDEGDLEEIDRLIGKTIGIFYEIKL